MFTSKGMRSRMMEISSVLKPSLLGSPVAAFLSEIYGNGLRLATERQWWERWGSAGACEAGDLLQDKGGTPEKVCSTRWGTAIVAWSKA